jgi:hypothetical protein
VNVSSHGEALLSTLPVSWRRLLLLGGAALFLASVLGAAPAAPPKHTSEQCATDSKAAAAAALKSLNAKPGVSMAAAPAAPAPSAARPAKAGPARPIKKVLTTLRGELVDYYCYMEKGARGPEHRECALRCVAGDICMGLLTLDEKQFMMLSVQHLRVMEPLAWKNIPDPFTQCRGLLGEVVDLSGYVMERRGQKIIEVTAVKVVKGIKTPAPKFALPPPKKPGPDVVEHSVKRQLTTLRGELVDFYCYIEKGARGPEHRDCAVRCVSGDVCMGILTTDEKQLLMLSVNHLRAMDPMTWRAVPDPFNKCRGLLAQTVDLTGYVIEKKGQKIIEVTDVKVVPKA